MAFENLYLDYTEVDTGNNRLTVTSEEPYKVQIDDVKPDEVVYLYKDFGADHFGDEFEHLVTFIGQGSQSSNRFAPVYGHANGLGSIGTGAGDEIGNFLIWNANRIRLLRKTEFTSSTSSFATGLSLNTPYYCKLKRSTGTVYAYAYTDSNRTNLINSVSGSSSTAHFRYNIAHQRHSSLGAGAFGTLQDIDIQEITPPTGFNPILLNVNQIIGDGCI